MKRDLCLHDLFHEQAARTPGAVALRARGASLTYSELAERSGRLAAWMRGAGVGPEKRVAVCLERSADLVAALLGILEAGGAYVPLDPAYPGERLAYLLEDCGAEVLLTSRAVVRRLPETTVRTVLLEDLTPRPPLPSPHPRPGEGVPPPKAENLAYVLYTSGSTGLPKGVAVEHRSAVAFIEWAGSVFTDAELAGVLAATSISFDLSVFEIFLPLARGGTVILAENALAFATLPEKGEVTLLNTVPSLLGELLRKGPLPPSVRTVNLAGEPLRRSLVDRIEAERVYNLYGPTESTTYATWTLVPQGVREEPTIGRPIAGTRVVLDEDGEIFLGGAGLARGYLQRPELTAELFVPDPSSSVPGERLYRTGDLGRLLPSGEIEYLGRADHQIKVQGLRIEPGEIENALLAFPGVREALVVQREGRLVAYLVPRGEAVPVPELRAFLRQLLPGPYVPSAFVLLAALPLTPNGKIDRKALPAPEAAAAGSAPPRNPVEELLVRAWAEELDVEGVGIDDDFFALGGHSLIAYRVLARVRDAFGVDLHLRELFEAPTPATLAVRIDAAGGERAAAVPLEPVGREGDLPLSFGQERLWFLHQVLPGNVYNLPLALRIQGPFDPAAWERAVDEVRRRHDALRTTFRTSAGRPVQVIEPWSPSSLLRIDLSAYPEPARETEAARLAAEEAARPFDLQTGPLLRATLLRLAPDDHLALLVCHHIVADGWSLGVLLDEIAAVYEDRRLPPLPVQYSDYAVWQRRRLTSETLSESLAWWRETLAGQPVLDLPADRPRPPEPSHAGALVRVEIPGELVRSMRGLARETGSTLFMALVASFAALLHRLTGSGDVRVGTPVAHRVRPELEGLVGFFVNTLVLRVDLSEEPHGNDLLARVRANSLGAWAHQDVPFEKLVEELRPERHLDQNPLFQVALGFDRPNQPALDGLQVVRMPVHSGTSKFDLYAGLEEDASGGISGSWELATDLFDRSTVQRFCTQWLTLLAGLAADPGKRVAELPLLSAAERHQLAHEWNDTAAGYPREANLWDLFALQAERAPKAIALVHGGEELTYGELADRARILGASLRALGVGPDVPVALALPQGFDRIVAILGVLEAGGAYVPLDLTHPQERRDFLLRDTGAAVLVTQGLTCRPVPLPPLPVEGGAMGEGGRGGEVGRGKASTSTDNLAYVLYTSGSTGTPKGVAVTHRNVIRLVFGTSYARFGPDEVFLQSSPIAFDASTLEIWGALLHGGRLVLPTIDRPSLAELGRAIRGGGVTTLWLTAGLFHEMVDEELDGLAGVRQLLAGGDVVSPAAVRAVLDRNPGTVVIDGYGPTEGTTFSACHRMSDPAAVSAAVPIGQPIGNARALVLDRFLKPVPVGVPGELYLGGDGIARGYFGRPDLTAERFVPGDEGERLYRTGDRVRWLPDGTLDYLGRIDLQVKVSGWRVEPGEIEALLAAHPAVRQSAVVARDEPKRLVAYVVLPRTDPTDLKSELREWLRSRLPEPMIPALWVFLDRLPLTPNGKIDRAALPAPEARPAATAAEAPRTPVEELLAGLWADFLGVERVGLHDDFFVIGGHSLLATRLIARVSQVLGLDLPLHAFFEDPTVAGMAARLDGSDRAAAPPLEPVERGDDLPLSFAQERLWFLDQILPGHVYNVPLALRLQGPLDAAAWEQAIDEIRQRHEALRTVFRAGLDGPVQVVEPWSPQSLPRIDLSALPEPVREAERIAAAEAAHPFDLATGPLLRASLLRIGENDHLALIVCHHIVADGWSIGVLLDEIAALSQGTALPPLPIQYPDYAVWQRRWLTEEALTGSLAWWRQNLAGQSVLELPTDRPRPPVPSHAGALVPVEISTELARSLRSLARDTGTTLFMVLLAGFASLLHRLTGGEDVRIGAPVSHRVRPELEGLIGFFVNTLVLRVDLAGAPTGVDLLARVRASTLGAWAHQDVPFEKLVEELRPGRRRDQNPLFQVALGLDRPHKLDLGSLHASRMPVHSGTSKFDLYAGLEEDSAGQISGFWELSTDLFDPATIDRLSAQWLALLADLAADPARPVSEPALVSRQERLQLAAVPAPAARPAEAPRTPVQELLADLWADLLGVERVGLHDDFFELGGHSLLATRLIARVRRVLGVDLPLTALFDDPTVAGLAAQVALLQEDGASQPMAPAPPAATYPASLGQRRLWFLQRLAPEGFFFNVSHGLRLRGPLQAEALRRALQEITARHEPLRTTFETAGGLPVQRIAPPSALPLPLADLSALPLERREDEARRVAVLEAEQPFDLVRGPLFRAGLVRLDTTDHALLLTPHHLVFDGWSMELLFRELAALYGTFSRGLPPDLPPLPARFVDFSEWQRQLLAGPVRDRQLAWWKERLAGLRPLDLPTDHPRPAVQRFRGGFRTTVLPASLTAALERLGRRSGATPFMILLAAFAALLARWTGQADVPVGAPRADRARPEVEGLIGFFVNTLVLRMDLDQAPSFSEVVARVRETALGAWKHQDLPFEVLVEELVPERDLSANPLIQVTFSLEQVPSHTGLLSGLDVEPFDFETDVALFDLSLFAHRSPEQMAITANFRRDLFDGTTAARLLEQLEILLAGAVADPEARAWDLPLWSEAAWHQVAREWNDTDISADLETTVDRAFERQAARAPEALAASSEERRLLYGELDREANRLARFLRRRGVRRGTRVALVLDPSPEMITAALAVWKAGGTYIPLDPAAPAERLDLVIADAGASVVLSRERWDADRALWADESAVAPEKETGPGDLACIIYTSGSTGVPKGAVLVHRGLLNLIAWHLRTFQVAPADRVSQVVNPSFDVNAWETWAPLTVGASLHALPRELVSSAGEITRWMAAREITLTFLPTPMAEEFLRREPQGLSLRALYIGGDRLRQIPPRDPGFRFVNAYGPAETSVVSTAADVIPDPAPTRPPSIGRPMTNAQVLLLDPQLRPVPLGAVGEICVGSPGLAAGYAGRPDLTADRFVPHPVPASPGARLYRTGDLGRCRADGTLDFVGRADFQVKIRGVRIELGEVEAQLNRHPELQAAVVAARDDGGSMGSTGGRRLVAWVVPRPGASPTPGGLRDFLRTKLPDVMVPTAWVVLDSLPLTPRGKVDRRALPAPPPAAVSREAPEGQSERTVARLWSEVLGVGTVGRDDNFFDLGGHSLALAAVHEKLQAELGVRLPMVTLFENTTVRSLAARLATPAEPETAPDVQSRAGRQRGAAAWKDRTRQARALARVGMEETAEED